MDGMNRLRDGWRKLRVEMADGWMDRLSGGETEVK